MTCPGVYLSVEVVTAVGSICLENFRWLGVPSRLLAALVVAYLFQSAQRKRVTYLLSRGSYPIWEIRGRTTMVFLLTFTVERQG